jgi:spore coat protein U-like protein
MFPALKGFVLAFVGSTLFAAAALANSCTLSTVAVAFGNYNIFAGADLHANGSVTYKCTQNKPITIQLNKGSSTTFNPRTMKFSTDVLNYNLYMDAALTVIWGDGTGGSSFYSNSTPTTAKTTLTVYGDVPALQQNVSAGTYNDSITATISF